MRVGTVSLLPVQLFWLYLAFFDYVRLGYVRAGLDRLDWVKLCHVNLSDSFA